MSLLIGIAADVTLVMKGWTLTCAVIAVLVLVAAFFLTMKGRMLAAMILGGAGVLHSAIVAAGSLVVPSTVWGAILSAYLAFPADEQPARQRELASHWDAFHEHILVWRWMVLAKRWQVCHELWSQDGCRRAPQPREAQGLAREFLTAYARGRAAHTWGSGPDVDARILEERTQMTQGLTWWTMKHGELAPVGYVLRRHDPARWIRFHSLPDSRQYPRDEGEMREVVRRALAVAKDVFLLGEDVVIYRSGWQSDTDALPGWTFDADPPYVVLRADPDAMPREQDMLYRVTADVETWPFEAFDGIVRRVAVQDEDAPVCVASPLSGNVFCPYGGGMDVFVDEQTRAVLDDKYTAWRSAREDGL